MAGFSISLMFAVLGGLALAYFGTLALAAGLFIAATVVTIVFLCGRRKRAAEGRRLGGKIAIPIALYVISVPMLAACIAFAVWLTTPAPDESGRAT